MADPIDHIDLTIELLNATLQANCTRKAEVAMSVVGYHKGRADRLPIISEQTEGTCADVTPMRYRGWALLALGVCSWAGLFKILGWL